MQAKRATGGVRQAPAAAGFAEDPLSWLLAAAGRTELAELAVQQPGLSRDPEVTAVVCAFGAAAVRRVLSDPATFRMPLSAAVRAELPDVLVNLNRSVFSMAGTVHRERVRTLGRIIGAGDPAATAESVRGALSPLPDQSPDLLTWTREFAGRVAERLVLGGSGDDVSRHTRSYFDLRRRHAGAPSPELRAELIAAGRRLDAVLRDRVRDLGSEPRDGGMIGRLLEAADDWAEPLSEDEAVAHANILLTASGEPIATALAWTLLALTQRPALMRGIRQRPGRELADWAVAESLRLAPPNAVMSRVSTQPVVLAGRRLGAGTEILLSPFVEHRDPASYPAPHAFRPWRWQAAQPSAWQYFPFGTGARACLGRAVAVEVVSCAVAELIGRYDVGLAADSVVDWRMSVTLLPVAPPAVRLRAPGESADRGRLLGPARILVGLPALNGVSLDTPSDAE
jgi:cytochrome P450